MNRLRTIQSENGQKLRTASLNRNLLVLMTEECMQCAPPRTGLGLCM